MLRKIPIQQLRVGMFVHEVCGSWIEHPFWRASFKVTDARQMAQLAVVKELIIDTDKGLDIDSPEPDVVCIDDAEIAAAPEAQNLGLASNNAPKAGRASFQKELVRAQRIVAQSRTVMQTMFQDVRMGKAMDIEHCLPLVDDITQSVFRNPGTIVSLARLKTSDDYTYMHSVAVCALMVSLAKQLELSPEDTREAGMAGLLHDIGKALMPQDVLNKPGALTPAEFAIMKGHPEAGHRMLVEGQGVGEAALDVCLHHHEKFNGKGYPHGLEGEAIGLFARMGAVCDVYDAITSNRPYKVGWDPADSIQKMSTWTKAGHFDERIFQAFVRSVGIYPIGALVKLKSGKLAVVVEQGKKSLVEPVVRVFFSTKANEPIAPELLNLGAKHVTDQIVSRESPATWGFKHLDDLWLTQPLS
ncbi:MAG: HD-GYP domain-containing protein [Aquabacterium sp.]|nr:HD-GYP domain-containing protein [Aquabacterium sp.]